MSTHRFAYSVMPFIKQAVMSLEKDLPLVFYVHDMIFPDQRLTMLPSHESQIEIFSDMKKVPNYTNEGGRVMEDGVYTLKILQEKYGKMEPSMDLVAQMTGMTHGIHVMKRASGVDHLFTFGFQCSDAILDSILLHERERLLDFIVAYQQQYTRLIHEGQRAVNQIKYRIERAPSTIQDIQFYDEKRNFTLSLTPQQSQCLKHLLEGYTIKEIANEMRLSFRTVQHYVDIIRQKYGYKNITQLVLHTKRRPVSTFISK